MVRSMDDNIEIHTFLYFAYGSNLLKERLQLKNPSASIHCVARLKDYKLIFGNYKGLASDRWHGGVATIENSPADEVWGVVWRMNVADLESLDSQENVRLGAYSPVEVNVKTRGQELNCRTYIMNSCIYAPPSPQYLKVTHLLLHSFPPPFYLSLYHTLNVVNESGALYGYTVEDEEKCK
uniref:Gamma-glutamylcyclotransferase n=1 Tax=Oncorhynchus tshawytscha TaxID=74940 RepID=A0A8C8IWV6_ONCTS